MKGNTIVSRKASALAGALVALVGLGAAAGLARDGKPVVAEGSVDKIDFVF